MSFLYFAVGTMVGFLVASSVFFTFCFDGGHEKEKECEKNRFLQSVVDKQDYLIAALEEALYSAATCYLGKFDDCRTCCFGYTCKVHNQDDVDACIETVMEGWKDEARRIMQ